MAQLIIYVHAISVSVDRYSDSWSYMCVIRVNVK